MGAHVTNRFSPMLGLQPCYIVDGHTTDPLVTTSRAEVEQKCEDLNGDRANFAVILLSPDGTWTDVSEDFWHPYEEEPDDDENSVRRHGKWLREQSGAFR